MNTPEHKILQYSHIGNYVLQCMQLPYISMALEPMLTAAFR